MSTPTPLITLLTDFGYDDPYVAIMKGVLLTYCPRAQLVDLCHSVPPQDVQRAGAILAQAVPHFPRGTVHLCVVDPGVGTERRAVAARGETSLFVAPDNGLLSRALERHGGLREAIELPIPPHASATFHGRDVFAPAAARLAGGSPLAQLGTRLEEIFWRSSPKPKFDTLPWRLPVLGWDRFGNVAFDVTRSQADGRFELGRQYLVDGQPVPFVRTFGEVAPGEELLLWNSQGLLELATNGGNARASRAWVAESYVAVAPVPQPH